jgi:LPS transport system D
VRKWRWTIAAVLACLWPAVVVLGQSSSSDNPVGEIAPGANAQSDNTSSDRLMVDCTSAATWSEGDTDIAQLDGPVTIRLDRIRATAKRAVIWLSPQTGPVIARERAQIALIGDAAIEQPAEGITRSGPILYLDVSIRGEIRLSADVRVARDESDTPLYRQADALRMTATAQPPASGALQPEPGEAKPAAPTPYVGLEEASGKGLSTGAALRAPLRFQFKEAYTVPTSDDTLAVELNGNVSILESEKGGDYVELQAERAVLFTKQKARGAFQDIRSSQSLGTQVTSAYLEGNVRVDYVPQSALKLEQRLTAQRVYYDFETNRAVLTDAILRTSMPVTLVPIVVRAQTLRQLSVGEYEGENAELTTSSFATPTYEVRTQKVYVVQNEVPLPYSSTGELETQTSFVAQNDTVRFWDVPAFYTPRMTGTIDQEPTALRTIDVSNTTEFGFGIASEFGVFEAAGEPHPKDLDLSVLADYFSLRGPATGINASYYGQNIDSDTDDLTDWDGKVRSFIISDKGQDILYGDQADVTPPDETRGKFLIEHQQFFPDNWQAQLRFGYVSDPTLLEEYFPKEFWSDQPYDAVAYFKRQEDTEVFTFLARADTNTFPTTSDQFQEQFDVEELPKITYQRVGDSIADDNLTFFSDNSVARLRFDKSHYSLDQEGFDGTVNPGLESEGYTGTVSSPDYREDSRQEVDWPIHLGPINIDPYVTGRATEYSASPEQDAKTRIYGATGVRMTTDFWKVDDTVQSDLLDLYRIRHIIEPEINLYTSGETVDRDQLYIYDENVDGISDISALEGTLHQRWETYRGGPEHQRSVDFLTLDVSADVYTNPPQDAGLLPDKFRGLYFPSDPEASIPRDAINSDMVYLLSDNTAILSDAEYNVDHAVLATASIGMAVQRYDRVGYYLGLRYIEQLNSDIATFAIVYQLTAKYLVVFSQGYDFGAGQDVGTDITVERQFDRLTCDLTVFHDSVENNSGVEFNIYPTGLVPANRSVGSIGSLFAQPQ